MYHLECFQLYIIEILTQLAYIHRKISISRQVLRLDSSRIGWFKWCHKTAKFFSSFCSASFVGQLCLCCIPWWSQEGCYYHSSHYTHKEQYLARVYPFLVSLPEWGNIFQKLSSNYPSILFGSTLQRHCWGKWDYPLNGFRFTFGLCRKATLENKIRISQQVKSLH